MYQVTPRTLRYYEDQGIITPQREGQRRIYNHRDRTRLKLALRGKRLGFSLAECTMALVATQISYSHI
jgi:DNA-binding transcriptional MerR regulator